MKKLILVVALLVSVSNVFAMNYSRYEGEWLSRKGSNSISCSNTLYDRYQNVCYQNCQKRDWTSSYQRRDGFVVVNGYWQSSTEFRTWYRYYYVNFQRRVYCR